MSWIADENSKPGTSTWRIANPSAEDVAGGHLVAGYLSATSALPGENLTLFAQSASGALRYQVFRMGWYGGLGGRDITPQITVTQGMQAQPLFGARNTIECDWEATAQIDVGADWTTGVYLVRLEAAGDSSLPGSGQQAYVPFVVKDSTHQDALIFQCCVNTYQAYNSYGHYDLYQGNNVFADRSLAVSFNRPYFWGLGAADFWNEYPMLRWLERLGYDVVYTTSVDTHADPDMLLRHAAWLSVGHDEYISYEARGNVEAALAAGTCIAFIGGNPMYWQVRFEAGVNGENRTLVCYKHPNTPDPLVASNPDRVTCLWRDPPVSRPEQAFIGVSWDDNIDFCQARRPDVGGYALPLSVAASSHWAYGSSGLSDGDNIPGVVGVEFDRAWATQMSPPDVMMLAHSPVQLVHYTTGEPDCVEAPSTADQPNPEQRWADTIIRRQKGVGSKLFAAGSIIYNWRLDDTDVDNTQHREWQLAGPSQFSASAPLQQVTRNILDHFLTGPLGVASIGSGTEPTTIVRRTSWRDPGVLRGALPSDQHVVAADLLKRGSQQLVFAGLFDDGETVQFAILDVDNDPVSVVWMQPRGAGTWPLEGWMDVGDTALASDFLGRGYDQLLGLNTSTNAGDGLVVLDFADNVEKAQVGFYCTQNSPVARRILDADVRLPGDFAGLGSTQMFAAKRGTGPEPWVDLISFPNSGNTESEPTSITAGNASIFTAWLDVGDTSYAGNFLGNGRTQLLLVNTSTDAPTGDGVIILSCDQSGNWNNEHYEAVESSPLRQSVHTLDDVVLIGNFLRHDRDQVVVIPRSRLDDPGLYMFEFDASSGFKLVMQVGRDESSLLNGWRNATVTRTLRRGAGPSTIAFLQP
jgi:hypothetical protein